MRQSSAALQRAKEPAHFSGCQYILVPSGVQRNRHCLEDSGAPNFGPGSLRQHHGVRRVIMTLPATSMTSSTLFLLKQR